MTTGVSSYQKHIAFSSKVWFIFGVVPEHNLCTLSSNSLTTLYSDLNAPNIPKQEVVDAASAVEKFLELARKK
jgi:hypothetical protein